MEIELCIGNGALKDALESKLCNGLEKTNVNGIATRENRKVDFRKKDTEGYRFKEEKDALEWSVMHAVKSKMISELLQPALLSVLHRGALKDVRDVLFHKCHLIPATRPLSELKPTSADVKIAHGFDSMMKEVMPVESEEQMKHKVKCLVEISNLVIQWIEIIGHNCGLSEEQVSLSGGALFVAGSHRLELNDPESDIDAVCVAPWHVTRDDFFNSFQEMLKEHELVSNITAIPHAFVPIMSIVYDRVQFDLLFARLPRPIVDTMDQDIDSDHVLAGMDTASIKSLNAPRNSTLIYSLVPCQDHFKSALKMIRFWAKRRGLYSSKLGYLGGISWAILVAFVCQLYPKALPATIVCRFFQTMSEWAWPHPIFLSVKYDAGLGHEMWDPVSNIHDRMHIMPIITPAYPPMNSAYQVSHATFSVMAEEFWRARSICEMISYQQMIPATATISSPLEALFTESNFFVRYSWYLVIDITSPTTTQLFPWVKFVESRLRKLVESLQQVNTVSRVHIFPKEFRTTSLGNTPGCSYYIGLQFPSSMIRNFPPMSMANLNAAIKFFVATDLQQFKTRNDGNIATTQFLAWKDLPSFVFPQGLPAATAERIEFETSMKAPYFMPNPYTPHPNGFPQRTKSTKQRT